MKVCMIVCLVLYILLYVLCYFIICVCQWENVYESLYDCVSCPVYIVVRLMLFHYRCVSVWACVWKFVWLCVVLYILSYVLCYFTIGVCQFEHVYESLYDCVLSCINCRTSYVIHLYVCVSESMCMKVCMIVCCPVYIVVRLMLFHYRCVSVRACVWKFVWLCVLSCIYCRTSYVISLSVRACVWKFVWLYVLSMCMKVCMIVCCPVYIVVRLMLFHYRCVSVMCMKVLWVVLYLCYFIICVCQLEHVYESLYDCVLSCIYCRTSYVISL